MDGSVRKLIASLAVAFLGLSTPAFANTVFFDDFNSGAAAPWANEVGNWTALGGVYAPQHPSTFPNAHSLVSTPSLSDFAVSVEVNHAVDGGIWLHAADTVDQIGASGILFVFANGLFYWHSVVNGVYGGFLETSSSHFSGGANFYLTISVVGDVYQAFVNGNLVTSLQNSAFSSGLTGVYSNASGQSFDNFKIDVSAVPLPAAAPLMMSAFGAIGALCGWRRLRHRRQLGAPNTDSPS